MAEHDFEGVDAQPGSPRPTVGSFDPRNKHPEYSAMQKRWQTTRDIYLGAEGIDDAIQGYMPRRMMGESVEAYDERTGLFHASGLLGALVDALVGLWARKAPEDDTWGALGGQTEDGSLEPGSVAAKMVEDADRGRITWDNHRRALATWMLTYRKAYVYIDTNKKLATGEADRETAEAMGWRPYVTRIPPLDLTDWVEEDGRKIEAVIREGVDPRTSLDDGEGTTTERYLRLKLEGWQRYEIRKDGESVKPHVLESGEYDYRDENGRRRLPLVEVRMPMPRYAAYNLALIERSILNADSYLDTLIRAGALAQYLAVQGDEDEVRKSVKEGDKVLPYPIGASAPTFVAYVMEAAAHIKDRIANLVERFWQAAMYEFSDRAAQKTATEIDQQWAAGIGATLSLIAGAMSEAENEQKFLLRQAAGLEGEDGATTFPREYRVEDVLAEMARVKDLVFGIGGTLPVAGDLEAAVAEYILRRLDDQLGLLAGFDGDAAEEIRAVVQAKALERSRITGLEGEMRTQPGFPEEEVA